MTKTTTATSMLRTMMAKEEEGRDNEHKITSNCCDGDGWQCAMHWMTVAVDTMMTATLRTKMTSSGLKKRIP
jgi:hypothetical protein